MRRAPLGLVGLGVALLAGCQGGLFVENGNAYPCRFDADPAVRDQACPARYFCTTQNVCDVSVQEGIPDEFASEPTPTGTRLPFAATSGRYRAVARNGSDPSSVVALTEGGQAVEVSRRGIVALSGLPELTTGRELRELAVLSPRGSPGGFVAAVLFAADAGPGVRSDGGVAVRVTDGLSETVRFAGGDLEDVRGLRVGRRVAGADELGILRDATLQVGRVETTPLFLPFTGKLPDGGAPLSSRVLDFQYLSRADLGGAPVFLTDDGFFAKVGPGLADNLRKLNPDDEPPKAGALSASMRASADGALLAVRYRPDGGAGPGRPPADVLSVWSARREGTDVVLSRVFNDCTPCENGFSLYAPYQESSAPRVELLCDGETEVAVVAGSSAPSDEDACQVSRLGTPEELTAIRRANDGGVFSEDRRPRGFAFDRVVNDGLLLGGPRGELWRGDRLTTLRPLFLDRVPLSAGRTPDGGLLLATNRYLSLSHPDAGLPAYALSELSPGLPDDVFPSATAAEVGGLLVLSSGELAQLREPSDAGLPLLFGPALLDARGARAEPPFLLDATRTAAGTASALVATSFDSLYFWPFDEGALQPNRNASGELVSVATPEPNFPIRSIVLDRTQSKLDRQTVGETLPELTAYVATPRSVFAVRREGSPARFTVQPLRAGLGEPVEVWMDAVDSARGRAGYRDGTVFSLPSGIPLAGPLPDGDRALDYGSLGGWPVALTEAGLFIARFPKKADGSERINGQERLVALPDGGTSFTPILLEWRRMTLAAPDPVSGSTEPWTLSQKKALFVQRRDPSGAGAATYALYVFIDHGFVYEVATLQR